MSVIIEFKNVSKKFILSGFPGQKMTVTTALQNINFTLEKYKSLAILGPNGAGKTTLLKIISTLILPDSGAVEINGYLVGKDDGKIKSIIGLASAEERTFYSRLSGNQNLEFFAALYGLNKKEIQMRLGQLFKLFAIDYGDRRFDSYSTGMKRKFCLIRALLHNPEILLLDEPTKSLDYNSACELREYIGRLNNEGKTVIFTTHNIEEAENLCDLFLILYRGEIFGFGTKEELKNKANSHSADLAEIYLKLTQNA
ncbi:MAG: ABC transporter ATP-binding protein [Candidatus Omnitrophica bacterium]|nr:ABC transporter ATP-binding protein [Candidatus Omnitrophota bacterium]